MVYRWALTKDRERQGREAPPPPYPPIDMIELPLRKQTSREHVTKPPPEENAGERPIEKYRWKIITGLATPFTLQAIDTTIIASSAPFIAEYFHHESQFNWIISVFSLTSAAFLPFWAQIADIFGRHVTMQATIVILSIGSAICTGAHAFGVLLVGRAIQGVGTAGVSMCVKIILADRVSLADYALNAILFTVISVVGFSIGAAIGGPLAQVNWRWCFAINLPVSAVAIILLVVILRRELLGPQPLPELDGDGSDGRLGRRRGRFIVRLATIDYIGQLLFLLGLGLLILGFTWAGATYAWSSAAVLSSLIIGFVVSVAWVMYEYSMSPSHFMSRVFPIQRPMMPWELLLERDISLLFFINCTQGMCTSSVMYFMAFYFAKVEGKSASGAGLSLLYFLPGFGVGALSAMFSVNVWPRQTLPPLLLGGVCSGVGITVIAWAISAAKTSSVYGMMALIGFGVGVRMNICSTHGLALFPFSTSAITCLVAFAQPVGNTVALTLMSTVYNNKSGAEHQYARTGIVWAFIAVIPLMWASLLLTTFLGNVWLLKDGNHEVVRRAYFWSFLTRKDLVREQKTRGGLVNCSMAANASDETL